MNHSELKTKALSNPETSAEFNKMQPEFALLRQMLKARNTVGLSQAEVAERMGTQAPSVARLESSLGNGKHSPSLATLRRYAHAVGHEIQVKLIKSQSIELEH